MWLLGDKDTEARIDISRQFLRDTSRSSIGFEALQKRTSLSKSKLDAQISRIQRIRKALASDGTEVFFSVHAPFMPIEDFNLASESPMVRRRSIEAVWKSAKLAEDIGARVVNTHLGGIFKTSNDRNFSDPTVKKKALDRITEALVDIVGKVEGLDVLLAVENMPYPLEETPPYSPMVGMFPRDFSEIFEAVGSKSIALTVDFCHLWIVHKTIREFLTVADSRNTGDKTSADRYHGLTSYDAESLKSLADNPFEAFIKPLGDKIIHVHVADSDGTYIPGTSSVSEGKPLGEGDLDLDGLANSLKRIERCSPSGKPIMVVVEPREADFSKPLNALRSLLRLSDLIDTKINS